MSQILAIRTQKALGKERAAAPGLGFSCDEK